MSSFATPVFAVADTSVLVAAFNGKDDRHRPGVEVLNVARTLVISPLVLAELDHLLTRQAGELDAVNAVTRIGALAGQGRVMISVIDREVLAEAEDLMRQYQGHALGLADSVNAVLAWRLKRPAILSFDSHYATHFGPRRVGERRLEVFPDPNGG